MYEPDYDKKQPPQPPIPPRKPRFPLWLMGILLVFVFVVLCTRQDIPFLGGKTKELTVEEFEKALAANTILEVEMVDNRFQGKFRPGGEYESFGVEIPPTYLDFRKIDEYRKVMKDNGVEFKYRSASTFLQQWAIPIIIWAGLFAAIYFIFIRQMRLQGGPGSLLSFGRSRARLATKEKNRVTFDDVAGIDEAKEEVSEIIEFLKNPRKFQRLGGRIPRGVLFVGPPGAGKTLLAKAIAGQADVPFFSICGSDFVEMFVGVGASRVRDLFARAKENSPCIIFLDEIDAVGRKRGSGLGGGHDEREQTLNAILVEMDGFETDSGVIVMAATNRPDVLDPALLRPGRFDREVVIDLPDVRGREEILRVHARKVKLDKAVDLAALAKTTPMFSGADLEAVINEAAIRGVMKDKQAVDMEDLEDARDKVRWGRQKRSKVMEAEDRRLTAVHESGHALVANFIPETDPLNKVTIIPRGTALGATMQMPSKDRYFLQRKYVLGQLTILYGGRAAEECFSLDVSSGARDDIKRATELARMMVCEWGMSEKLGPINYSEAEETLFLGREITRTRNHSESTAIEIDHEVHSILQSCFERAKSIVLEHKAELERVADSLMKHESLSGNEVAAIIKGENREELRKTTPDKRASTEKLDTSASPHPNTEPRALSPGDTPLPKPQEA